MEAEGIQDLCNRVNDIFPKIVHLILSLSGRVVVTGVGKSAIIAQKIAATFNSTGTPSLFMHAADAIHGDLGMIQHDDLIICISKSGNTPEIKVLTPLLKQAGNALVGMVGDMQSFLARQADFVLDTSVVSEACPHNLAPTTSTTAQLAMGDALAICLLESRAFSRADFARYHPGGSLGKRLYLKVGDLSANHEKPQVGPNTPIRDVLIEITKNRLGAVVVIDGASIVGIITDGDVRRMLEKYTHIGGLKASDIMSSSPKCIGKDELAVNALEALRENNITQIIVLAPDGQYEGIVHLHDLLKEGII
jgi:arabinose-5-phosphate isomerase